MAPEARHPGSTTQREGRARHPGEQTATATGANGTPTATRSRRVLRLPWTPSPEGKVWRARSRWPPLSARRPPRLRGHRSCRACRCRCQPRYVFLGLAPWPWPCTAARVTVVAPGPCPAARDPRMLRALQLPRRINDAAVDLELAGWMRCLRAARPWRPRRTPSPQRPPTPASLSEDAAGAATAAASTAAPAPATAAAATPTAAAAATRRAVGAPCGALGGGRGGRGRRARGGRRSGRGRRHGELRMAAQLIWSSRSAAAGRCGRSSPLRSASTRSRRSLRLVRSGTRSLLASIPGRQRCISPRVGGNWS